MAICHLATRVESACLTVRAHLVPAWSTLRCRPTTGDRSVIPSVRRAAHILTSADSLDTTGFGESMQVGTRLRPRQPERSQVDCAGRAGSAADKCDHTRRHRRRAIGYGQRGVRRIRAVLTDDPPSHDTGRPLRWPQAGHPSGARRQGRAALAGCECKRKAVSANASLAAVSLGSGSRLAGDGSSQISGWPLQSAPASSGMPPSAPTRDSSWPGLLLSTAVTARRRPRRHQGPAPTRRPSPPAVPRPGRATPSLVLRPGAP